MTDTLEQKPARDSDEGGTRKIQHPKHGSDWNRPLLSPRRISTRDVREPLTVVAAAASGSRRDLLVAMRTRIAVAVDDERTLARDLAALSRRLIVFAQEIELLDAAGVEDGVGEAATTPDEDWRGI